MPPCEIVEVAVAGVQEDAGRALGQPVRVVAQHDAGAASRHQAGEFELDPAQRHRAREQQMTLREDQLFAQIDERQLGAVGDHRP